MTAAETTVLEGVLRRDRRAVIAALVSVITLSWLWLLLGAGTGMSAVDMLPGTGGGAAAMRMMAPAAWSLGYAGIIFMMWWVMMAAMMLPSAAPILLLFARVNRKERAAGRPFVPTGIFAAGYLAAWGGFSLVATGLQGELQHLGLLSPMMVATDYWLGGAILLAAGIWQLTPIKGMCLRHCRSPMGFLVQSWRPGRSGAFRMGLEHGTFCLGCCWFLMGLLFFGGIMNLYWIIGLAVFVMAEKTIPMGSWVGRIFGVAVAAWGVAMFAAATLSIAAPGEYHFEAVETQAITAGHTSVTVRLQRGPDRNSVHGAVITEATTDMGPDGMPDMIGKVTPLASDRPGLYRFAIETGMAGKWELVLAAKVPGKTAPVAGKVVYEAR